jgi:hypothetical protein
MSRQAYRADERGRKEQFRFHNIQFFIVFSKALTAFIDLYGADGGILQEKCGTKGPLETAVNHLKSRKQGKLRSVGHFRIKQFIPAQQEVFVQRPVIRDFDSRVGIEEVGYLEFPCQHDVYVVGHIYRRPPFDQIFLRGDRQPRGQLRCRAHLDRVFRG